MREVDNTTAQQLMSEQAHPYVDVRTPAEFAEGHPAGSINIPISMGHGLNPDFIRIVSALYAKDAPLLLGCRTGGRSGQACQVLEHAGFFDVINVGGGFVGIPAGPMGPAVAGWASLGLPASTDVSERGYAAVVDKLS